MGSGEISRKTRNLIRLNEASPVTFVGVREEERTRVVQISKEERRIRNKRRTRTDCGEKFF